MIKTYTKQELKNILKNDFNCLQQELDDLDYTELKDLLSLHLKGQQLKNYIFVIYKGD